MMDEEYTALKKAFSPIITLLSENGYSKKVNGTGAQLPTTDILFMPCLFYGYVSLLF
jgi:hypothetical protein